MLTVVMTMTVFSITGMSVTTFTDQYLVLVFIHTFYLLQECNHFPKLLIGVKVPPGLFCCRDIADNPNANLILIIYILQ